MRTDVLALGEAIVDFIPLERGALRHATGFHMRSGGAPANVAIGAARLGARVGFVGVVGDDEFGWFLRTRLEAEGIDCADLRMTRAEQTRLCYISLDAHGERSFMHRGGDAPRLLHPDDIDPERFRDAGAIVFSSISLREDGVDAVKKAIDSTQGLVCCDPGFCPASWADPLVMRVRVEKMLQRCDIVKCSAMETKTVTGERDPEQAARRMVKNGAQLGVVTLGPHGAFWARERDEGHVTASQVEVVDTTGAGDAFMAALVSRMSIAEMPPSKLPESILRSYLKFACEQGTTAVTRFGAV